ncbi:hypothetical protein, partial [Endozoicomonas sp. ALB122]|uniref:hypothetical protein n=1 Tax=Endozoicomonas sp. ALB122 TaxID=3403075 RepID=UPI003BB72E44
FSAAELFKPSSEKDGGSWGGEADFPESQVWQNICPSLPGSLSLPQSLQWVADTCRLNNKTDKKSHRD